MSTKNKKSFEFARYKQRHVALKLLYLGWDYDGLVEQTNSDNTIEYHLVNALIKTCLIQSKQACKFNRCGRTDKGVSSYGQVVDLNIRSNLVDEDEPQNVGLFTPDDCTGPTNVVSGQEVAEINYVDILNRVLPDHIKVIAWAPAVKNFSSRFNCKSRSYSYVFPRGDLCIGSMEQGIKYLVGQHDFRNLCSYDLKNGVFNHVRTILATSIRPISTQLEPSESSSQNPYSFYEFIIVGQAFLYHQIRCIMTIIFLIGRKQEPPEVLRDLLDLNKCPSRPKYCPASPLPLSLFDCKYGPDDLPLGWTYNQQTLRNIHKQLKQLWLRYKTKAVMIERVLLDIESSFKPTADGTSLNLDSWKDFGLEHDNMSDTKYIPMLRRPREEGLESKIAQLQAKKKLKITNNAEPLDDT